MNDQNYYEEQLARLEEQLVPLYYDAIREVLDEAYANISDEEITSLLEEKLSGMTPEEVEAFWKSVGNAFKKVGKTALKVAAVAAPIAGQVAGGVLGSTIAPGIGTAMGAQLGGALGNIVGGVARKFTQPQAQTGAQPQMAAQPGVQQSQMTQQPGIPQQQSPSPYQQNIAPQISTQPAANQLMALLNNPQLLQAILGQVMGQQGKNTVAVSVKGESKAVPFGAFMTALSELAERAAIEANEKDFYSSGASYLQDGQGEYICDPASPEERTTVLMDLLGRNYIEEAMEEDDDEHYYYDEEENYDYEEDDAYYDDREADQEYHDDQEDEYYDEEDEYDDEDNDEYYRYDSLTQWFIEAELIY